MKNSIRYPCVPNPFFMESTEEGLNPEDLRYKGRGERRYGIGRGLLVRSCHDALVSLRNEDGERGVLLVIRNAEPALGVPWSLGGFFDRGVETKRSLSSRIKSESGLEVDAESYMVLGHIRAMWEKTPYTPVDFPSDVREFLFSQDLSKVSLQEALRLFKEKGFDEYVSGMNLQNFADLIQERNLPKGIDDTGLLFHVESSGGKLNLDKLHDRPRIITPKKYTPEFKSTLHEYMQDGLDRVFSNFY